MADTFVERRFELGDGADVVVRFARPLRDGDDFSCEYEIAWPHGTRAFRALGVDEVQALLLAMSMAHAELLTSPEKQRGKLRWFGADDLGLPDPFQSADITRG